MRCLRSDVGQALILLLPLLLLLLLRLLLVSDRGSGIQHYRIRLPLSCLR